MNNDKINTATNLFGSLKETNDRNCFYLRKDYEYDILTNEIYKKWPSIVVKKNTLLYKYLRENTLKEDK